MRNIQSILKKWKRDSKVDGVVQFKYDYRKGVLKIFTAKPGLFIGKYGTLLNKYKGIFEREIPGFKNIEFIETSYYWV